MKRIFNRLGIFIENKRLLVLIVCLALIVPSIFGAIQLEMKTGNDTFVSTDSEIYKDYERFCQEFSSDAVLILLGGDNLTQLIDPDNVAAMGALEDEINGYDGVASAIGPAFTIRQAAQQAVLLGSIPPLPENGLPDNSLILQGLVLDETGQIRSGFDQVFPDSEHAFIAVTMDGTLSADEQKEVIENIQDAVGSISLEGIEIIVTGMPFVQNVMVDSLGGSMRDMLLLSVGIMLLVLVLIFVVRGFFAWRWLPLFIVLIALVYTFGVMGFLSIPITMVTMAAFPILIGLGVDYAIQFHNRYDEEARRGDSLVDAIRESVTSIGPTVGIAVVAACLGFAALFFSPVPMIRDFGLTLIIGVAASYFLSIFLILPILYIRDHRARAKRGNNGDKKPKKEENHIIDKGLRHLAPWVIKYPAVILPIALLLCVGGLVADSRIETETDTMKYLDQDLPVIQDLNTAGDVLGGVATMNLFLEGDITDPEVLNWMQTLKETISEEQSGVVTSTNSVADLVMQATGGAIPPDSATINGILELLPDLSKSNFINDDYTAANMVITMKDLDVSQIEELKEQLVEYTSNAPEGLEVTVTGRGVFTIELLYSLSSGRLQMTLIGIGMVILGIFLLFKLNIYRSLLAVLPLVLIIGWSSGVMYLLGIEFTPITATLGALIIGIGSEYTILLVMRYYEERDKGERPMQAMTTAIVRIGRAVIASGFTTIGGFAALLIAWDFPIIQSFGVVTMINVFFALVSTLLVLPSMIVLVDRMRNKPKAKVAD